jgi:hypothetical protein
MDLRTYDWTPEGRQRVAWAIQATLLYNEQNGLRPSKIRTLATQAGLPNHTSLGKYHRGVTGHPNNAGGKILRAAAPFIYEIKAFHVRDGLGSDRLVSVDFVSPPNPQDRDAAPWEQPGVRCYDFDSLCMLGTRAGDALEVAGGQAANCPPEAIWLYELLKRMKPEALSLVARLTDVAPCTMESLVSPGSLATPDFSAFSTLSEVLKDFLVRKTRKKTLIWGIEELAAAKGINPEVSGLFGDRLRQIIFQGHQATSAELSRLAGCMAYYGVSWDIAELEMFNARQSSQEGLSRVL